VPAVKDAVVLEPPMEMSTATLSFSNLNNFQTAAKTSLTIIAAILSIVKKQNTIGYSK
jgi:hypothetical protein